MIANIDINGKEHGAIVLNVPFEPGDKDVYRNAIVDALQFISSAAETTASIVPTGAVYSLLEILRAFDCAKTNEQFKGSFADEKP